MIPGGYEKSSRRYNINVDDFDDYDDDDDEEEFILDSAYQSTQPPPDNSKTTDWQEKELTEMEKNLNDDSTLADNNNNNKTVVKASFFFDQNDNYISNSNKIDDDEAVSQRINVLDELKASILSKNLAHVKSLMGMHNIDVNCLLKSTNWTPIMLAANSGAFELVEYFVRNEADVNFEHDSYNVLMCACGSPNGNEYNQVKIVDLLLNKGVDVNSCDKYEQTPLMYACRAQNFFLVDLLVKHGAKIDAQDDNGWTALSHASYNGCLKSVKKLLRHGADPIIHTIDYLYPFDLAKRNGHTEIYQLLKNYLRMRRIEESKSSNNVLYELLDEFEDQDDGLANDRKIAEDLETFLRGLGLKSVLSLLKANRISLKTLLNCKVDDLKKIGIKDDESCQLIVGEIKKFHQKNWQSSALAEVNSDNNLNCIEAISIMSNLSRQIDFMSSNVRYVQMSGVQENQEIFADDFSSVKLKTECKLALNNCKDLMNNLNSLNSIVQTLKKVKKTKADRIDEVPAVQHLNAGWLKITPFKAVAFSTAAAFMISSIFIVKIKRTF